MFSFRKREAVVLNHWIAMADGFHCPPAEFYKSVEAAVSERKVPGLDLVQVEFAEGGMLSDKRLYLRMLRERLVFDICAAPFGDSFFFSCQFAEIPLVVNVWQLLVVLVVLYFATSISLVLFIKVFGISGLWLCPFAWIVACALAIYTMRNAVAMGLANLDETLIQMPIIGTIYEAWFRRETYYRHDTRLMYLEIVSGVVKKLAEDAVAAKGLKLVRQYEQAPILGELYKPVTLTPRTSPA